MLNRQIKIDFFLTISNTAQALFDVWIYIPKTGLAMIGARESKMTAFEAGVSRLLR
jgi:hypothetical protein